MRHPLHAYVAETNRKHSGNQTGYASPEVFRNSSFASEAQFFLDYWLSIHEDLHHFFGKPLHIVLYDNLINSPVQEVRECLRFLGLEMSPDTELCIKNYKDSKFKRKSRSKEDKDQILGLLSTEQIQRFDQAYDLILSIFKAKRQ